MSAILPVDRLTQTANSIDELIQIMYSTLSYLTRKASFKSVNPAFPVTQTIPNAEPPEVFEANKKELVADFLRKAKQLEYLISVLPASSNGPDESAEMSSDDDKEFAELETEMRAVNEEYLEALTVAEQLHAELSQSLRLALESRTIDPDSLSKR